MACQQSKLGLGGCGGAAAVHKALLGMKNVAGRTALHTAANHGQQAVVLTLLKAGADATVADKAGWTPLVRARLVFCCYGAFCGSRPHRHP